MTPFKVYFKYILAAAYSSIVRNIMDDCFLKNDRKQNTLTNIGLKECVSRAELRKRVYIFRYIRYSNTQHIIYMHSTCF